MDSIVERRSIRKYKEMEVPQDQINIIEARHRAEEEHLSKEERPKLKSGEYLGRFKKG